LLRAGALISFSLSFVVIINSAAGAGPSARRILFPGLGIAFAFLLVDHFAQT
jgi:hypothetical protein